VIPQTLTITLLGLAALAVLRLPQYAAQAAVINHSLSLIGNKTVQGQMVLPVAMVHILPIGIKGLFGTIMLFISFTCHDTYMHSWGSIFIQDVYIPISKRVLAPKEHILLLRLSILFVALFSYFFSLWYQPDQKILMYFAATGTIWLGGSGAVIIGGLYFKRGTTAAAYVALYCGAVLGFLGVKLPWLWEMAYDKGWIRHIIHQPV
jgi:SSS family solute:Na+ symporter